jgi:hypothetical protein
MSLVPGDSGQKTTLTDDVQVNHISENTLNHGVRVRGISDLTTYPIIAGDIGEKIDGVISGDVTISVSGTIYSMGYVTLTPGIWMIYGVLSCAFSSISNFNYFQYGISTSNSTLTGSLVTAVSAVASVSGSNTYTMPTAPFYKSVSTTTSMYLNGRVNFTTSITGGRFSAVDSSLFAIRIA